MIRASIIFATGAYLGAGLFAGLLMQRAIPALNPLGITYIAVTWPMQIVCARKDSGCEAAPPKVLAPYLFSFPAIRSLADEPRHGE